MTHARWTWGLGVVVVGLLVGGACADARDEVGLCRRAVDRGGAALARKLLALEQRCLAKRERGTLPPDTQCVGRANDLGPIDDGSTRTRAERLVATYRDLIRRGCTELTLALSPPEGLGFPFDCPLRPEWTCPAEVPAGGKPDPPFVEDVVACLVCTHVNAVHDILAVQHPDAAPGCEPVRVVTVVVDTPVELAGIALRVAYPDALALPGGGTDESVRNRVTFLVPGGLTLVADVDTDDDDVDDEIGIAWVSTTSTLLGPFAQIAFCPGNGVPPFAPLACRVLSAADGEFPVDAACHVEG